MGTRNLTAVVLDGKYVVAQYGQWDGYPSGQGATALEFCKKHLRTSGRREKFKTQLAKTRFVSPEEVNAWLEQVGSKDGWLNSDQVMKFDELAPFLTRDHGAKILELIFNAEEEEILLQNNIAFAGNSLFCEYAYVIDLDKNTFEAYKGFQTSPLPPTDRFANIEGLEHNEKYQPVKMVASWSLGELPTQEELSKAFKDLEPEEE